MFNLSLTGQMVGHGKLMVKRHDGSIDTVANNNTLLASFFTKAASGTYFYISPRLKVGTGTTATDGSTTQLAQLLAPVSGSWPSGIVLEEPIATLVDGGTKVKAYIKYQFAAAIGAFVGNISEYGLNLSNDSTTSSGIVDTRVLIKDIDGNPTTITLGALDQLIAEYSFEVLLPYADVVSTVTAQENGSPIDYEVTVRHAVLGKFSHYMNLTNANTQGAQTFYMTQAAIGAAGVALPAGNDSSQDNYSSVTVASTATGRTAAIDIPTGKGNLVGGIAGCVIGNRGNWYKVGFNPPLPKSANNNIKFNLNLSLS